VTSSPAGAEEWITLAVLGRTRGNRGELTAFPFSKPERFETLGDVHLFGDGSRYRVESAWWHSGILIFKFEGIDSISDAEPLSGCEVRVPRSERIRLEPGEYFLSDLLGCQVVDGRTGQPIGQVQAFDEGGGAGGMLVVGRDVLIPFVRSICRQIDLEAKVITVDVPNGLLDLNRP
jgi:16S rRNA processing protein RimM